MVSHTQVGDTRATIEERAAKNISQIAQDFNVSIGSMLDVVDAMIQKRGSAVSREDKLRFVRQLWERDLPRIEEESGPWLKPGEAGVILGLSDERVRQRVKANELAGYERPSKRGIRLPAWQFEDNRAAPWVSQLLQEYGNGWDLLAFLTAKDKDGRSRLDLIRAGLVSDVVRAVRQANAS
ncbi:MAG: hypothetical protein ACREIA_12745 [Opitutaceae bacterium]